MFSLLAVDLSLIRKLGLCSRCHLLVLLHETVCLHTFAFNPYLLFNKKLSYRRETALQPV